MPRISRKLKAATESAISLLASNQKLSSKMRSQLTELIMREAMQMREIADRQKQRKHEEKSWGHENELLRLKANTEVHNLVQAAKQQLRGEYESSTQ
jgi:hypothetical protein